MIETISIDASSVDRDANNVVQAVFNTVYDMVPGASREMVDGYTVRSMRSAPGVTVPDKFDDDMALIPAFMNGDNNLTQKAVIDGDQFPFTLRDEVSGHFGEPEGQSVATWAFVEGAMNVKEAVTHLKETGQIEEAKANVAPLIEAEGVDAPPAEVVAFAVATYALGWIAEQTLAQLARFGKLHASQDTGGRDFYDRVAEGDVQVKRATCNYDPAVQTVYYQFDCDGRIHYANERDFGDDDSHPKREVNGAAANVKGVSKTLIRQTHSSNTVDDGTPGGRRVRAMWW